MPVKAQIVAIWVNVTYKLRLRAARLQIDAAFHPDALARRERLVV